MGYNPSKLRGVEMRRETWGSRIGFILAVAGSAIGLANIWRFPFLTGRFGGAGFVFVYLISLVLVGFPVLVAEICIGRAGKRDPAGSFEKLGKSKRWGFFGKMTIFTGFWVSAFYSAVAGWIIGYLFEALRGNLTQFRSTFDAVNHLDSLLAMPLFTVGCHAIFLGLSVGILFFGIRGGIERANKILMPLLFVVLLVLLGYGLTLENSFSALSFLFKPDFSALTPVAILAALGQSFFTLSLGQGTMVTYGSYLNKEENLVTSCLPIVIMDTVVSLVAACIIFTIVFSVGMNPDAGPGLIFHTLPVVFSQIPAGNLLAPAFFLLVAVAALTSEISAIEPAISYLIDEWKVPRNKAVALVGGLVFLFGIPSALSTNVLKDVQFFGGTFLDGADWLASNLLIPLGGLVAVLLAGWKWSAKESIQELNKGSEGLFTAYPWLTRYFSFCFKYSAPVLITVVFLHVLLS